MNINFAKRLLLDKLRIIDQTDNDHWLLEPIHIALESMDKLEVYKKALELACNEIRDRDCGYYNFSDSCKSHCELYDVCGNDIEFENYYLQKAGEDK